MKKFFTRETIFGLIALLVSSIVQLFNDEIKTWILKMSWLNIISIVGMIIGWTFIVAGYIKVSFASSFKKQVLSEMERTQNEYIKSKKTEFDNYKSNVNDAFNFDRDEISKLWREVGKRSGEVNSQLASLQLLENQSFSISRCYIAYLNSLKNEQEVISMVDVLYGLCPIPDLEKFGLKGDVLKFMKAKYYNEKMGEA